jgi:hypothetical protein
MATDLAPPYRDAVAHAPGCGLEPAIGPIGVIVWGMKPGIAIEAVEIGADELAVLQADTGVVD